MKLPRTVASAALGLGLVLSLVVAACSGNSPEQGRSAAATEVTPDLGGSAATAIFRTTSPADPIVLPTFETGNATAFEAVAAELNATIDFWSERVDRDPRDFVALNHLGGLYIRRARLTSDISDYARARAAFEQSVASNRDRNLSGLTGLAHVSVFTHQFREARDLAREALAIKPNDPYARWLLGDAQLALGEYEDAYGSFTDPAALNDTLSAHSRVAFAEALRGDLAAAELQWKLAVGADAGRLPEESAWVRTQTGNFYLDTGRIEEARAQFDLALDMLPGDLSALAGRANVAIALGQLDEAIRIYEHLVGRQPLTEYVITLGELYDATGQPKLAQQQYDLVMVIDQLQQAAGIATDLQVARFLVTHGADSAEALAVAERAYEARPGVEAADTLAWAHYRAGDFESAKRYSDKALSIGTRRPLFLAHAGLIEYARGNVDEAVALLNEAQSINPRFSIVVSPLVAATLEAIDSSEGAQVAAR